MTIFVPSAEVARNSWQRKLECLETVTSCLSLTHTTAEVAAVIMDHVVPALQAERGVFYVMSEDGHSLLNVGIVGYSPAEVEAWNHIPLTLEAPLTDAIRTHQPVAIGSHEELMARYPHLSQTGVSSQNPALIALPMRVDDRPLGVIGISYSFARSFLPEDIAFKQSIAQQCAITLDRVRLYESEQTARQQAEAEQNRLQEALSALSASEERYRNLVELSPDATLVHHDFQFVYANPAALTLFKADSIEQLRNQSLLDFVQPAFREMVEQRARQLYTGAKQSVPIMEQQWLALDGTVLEVEGAGVCCTWQGHPAVENILRDIHERKRQEERQRETEQRFRVLADSAPVLIWLAGKDAQCFFFNKPWLDFRGRSLEEEAGSGWLEGVHPDDREVRLNSYLEAFSAHQPFRMEYRLRRWDGEYRWVLDTGVARFTEREAFEGYIGSCIDITERQVMEQALRQSQRRFQTFMDSSAILAWIVEAEGQVHYVNKSFARLFDAEPAALIGKTAYDLFPTEQAAVYIEHNREVLATGRVLETVETATLPDGTLAHYLVYKFALVDDNDVNGVLIGGIAIDITERKRLEEQYLQAQKMESIGRLAGGVAHDFNNLLSIILGYAELIEEELPQDDPLQSYVRTITDGATRAVNLTRQLLAFARRQPMEPKVLSPTALIEGMSQMLKPLIGEDIHLQTDLAADAGQVRIDPTQLEQVLVNLVVNARDAMPQGGTLTIQSREELVEIERAYPLFVFPEGRYVLLSVTDTGTGMTEEVKAKLFEPFFTTKGVGKGTGLGLATVFGIVKQNDGFILVESEVGKGTTFTIYLPHVESPAETVNENQSRLTIVEGIETILVVEDEPILRELAVLTLRQNGYTVLQAGDGVEAVQVAEAYPGEIHLLLTDAILPKMSGQELSERLRQERPNLQILLMSGYTEDCFAHAIATPPDVAFLAKPFTPSGLLAKVRETLTEGL